MKPSRQAPKVLPPGGLQKFRCIQVIDLGTQKKEYLGTVKYQKRVLLTFELVNTNHQFRDGEKEMPFVIKQEFTNSLSERGNLLPFLESWKGGAIQRDEQDDLDLFKICLNRAGLANITIGTSKKNPSVKFAQISAVMAQQEGEKTPAARNAIMGFEIGAPCPVLLPGEKKFSMLPYEEVYSQLYEWQQEVIAASPEFKALNNNSGDAPKVEDDENTSQVEMPDEW